jgi:protein-disulfide isomerase
MKRFLPFLLIIVVGAAAIAGGRWFYHVKRLEIAKSGPVDITAGALPGAKPPHIRGDVMAPVTLEEFGDYQCPPCELLSQALLRVEHDYGPKLRIIFRQFPLAMHNHAALAARAAEAAGLQDKFWEMHDLLYKNRTTWAKETDARPIFEEYASSLQLNMERFKKDIESREVIERVEADQKRGTSLGVVGTPSVFINGHMIPPTGFDEKVLRTALDAAVAGKPPVTATPTPSPFAVPSAAPVITPAPIATPVPTATPSPSPQP